MVIEQRKVTDYHPETVNEACRLREDYEDSLVVAGGTDIMVVKKKAPHMIFVDEIKELKEVSLKDGVLRIGAAAPYVELLENKLVPVVLKKAIRNIASPAVRSVGTIGGNICNASPAGDTLPVLYALSAIIVKGRVKNDGTIQEELVPIDEFIQGIRKIDLKPNELVLAIEIKTSTYKDMTKVMYEKVGARKSEAISKLSFVGLMKVEDQVIKDIRIAFGAVNVTAVRREEIEVGLIGKTLAEVRELKDQILAEYEPYIRPIDDQRSTAEYRKKVCMNLLRAFLS